MNFIRKSIATKLSLQTIIAILLIFIVSGTFIYVSTDNELNDSLLESVETETDLAVNKVSEAFALAEQVAKQAALDRNIQIITIHMKIYYLFGLPMIVLIFILII